MNFEVHLNGEGGIGPLPSETNKSSQQYEATTYLNKYSDSRTGQSLLGKTCPSCGSTLVVRVNSFDARRFIACDKTKQAYCKFSIGLNETLKERTARIEYKLSNRRR